MAYKRRRYSRRSRPRKRARRTYKRKSYSRRYSKFYNMVQNTFKSRQPFRPPRQSVASLQGTYSVPPTQPNNWVSTAAALALMGYAGYQGYQQYIKPWHNYVNDLSKNTMRDVEKQSFPGQSLKEGAHRYHKFLYQVPGPLSTKFYRPPYPGSQLSSPPTSTIAGRVRNRPRLEQEQTNELVQQGFIPPDLPTYQDFLASLNPDLVYDPSTNQKTEL